MHRLIEIKHMQFDQLSSLHIAEMQRKELFGAIYTSFHASINTDMFANVLWTTCERDKVVGFIVRDATGDLGASLRKAVLQAVYAYINTENHLHHSRKLIYYNESESYFLFMFYDVINGFYDCHL